MTLRRRVVVPHYCRYYYTNALELARLAIERYMHTLDDAFAEQTMLPLTLGALRFFYEHYGPSPAGAFYNNESWAGEVWTADTALGSQGDMRVVFTPAQCLETWQEAINPTDAIAGLISITDAVVHKLPKALLRRSVSKRDLAMVHALSAMTPALPVVSNAGTATSFYQASGDSSIQRQPPSQQHSKWHLTPAEYWSRNGNGAFAKSHYNGLPYKTWQMN